jgi:hypothetical protein
MKAINKKNLQAIKAYHKNNDADAVITFVLNSMTKFIMGDSKVSYGQAGAPLFASVDELSQNIRKTDHSKMDTADIQAIMRDIVGDEKSESVIMAQLSNPANL